VDHVRKLYIDPSHPVFGVVPPTLGKFIQHYYDRMGCPEVTRSSAWTVYRNLLSALQLVDNPPPELSLIETNHDDDTALPLLDGLTDLSFQDEPNGSYYMGGVRGGLGIGRSIFHSL
jgi:hypothetical protein